MADSRQLHEPATRASSPIQPYPQGHPRMHMGMGNRNDMTAGVSISRSPHFHIWRRSTGAVMAVVVAFICLVDWLRCEPILYTPQVDTRV